MKRNLYMRVKNNTGAGWIPLNGGYSVTSALENAWIPELTLNLEDRERGFIPIIADLRVVLGDSKLYDFLGVELIPTEMGDSVGKNCAYFVDAEAILETTALLGGLQQIRS
jgi:hypothetical protein